MSVGLRLSHKGADAAPRRFGTVTKYVPPTDLRGEGWVVELDPHPVEGRTAVFMTRQELAETAYNAGFGWRREMSQNSLRECDFHREAVHREEINLRMGRIYRVAHIGDGPGMLWDSLVFRGRRPDGKLVFQRIEPPYVDIDPANLRHASESTSHR